MAVRQRLLKIRPATEKDAAALGRVHADAWHAAYAGLFPQSYLATVTPGRRAGMFLRNVKENLAQYYLAWDGANPVGLLILAAPSEADAPPFAMEVAAVYLLPLYWGQGYGKQLLDYAVKTARDAGCKTLLLWVLAENPRAIGLYEKYGFIPDGGRKTIARGRQLEQLRYRLEL